mgnify:CR=1 FL=1
MLQQLFYYSRLVRPLLFLIIFFSGKSGVVSAQNRGVEPDDHQPEIYQKNGKFYIQANQKLYIYATTDEKSSAKKFQLENPKNSKSNNGMTMNGHGVHRVAHISHQGKQKVGFPVFVDGRAPRCELSLSKAPRKKQGDKVYYGKGLQADIQARDPFSGLKKVYLARDGGAFKPFGGSFSINEERDHQLEFYAVDRVGNVSQVANRKFTVDLTPPQTTHDILGTRQDDIISSSSSLRFSSTDQGVGVQLTFYKIDGANKQLYNDPLPLKGFKNGSHKVEYFSEDYVKNTESKKTFQFYLDKNPPEASIALEGPSHRGDNLYVSPQTKFLISASDNKAGVKKTVYEFNRKPGRRTYSGPFKLIPELGIHVIDYFAIDNVNNASSIRRKRVFYDDKPPTTNINVGQPKHSKNKTIYITKNTKIILNSGDAHAGVSKIMYKVNNQAFKPYQSPFTIDQDENCTISYYSIDRVGNEEEISKQSVYIDNLPPKITHNFNLDQVGTKNMQGQSKPVYSDDVRLALGATDQQSGTKLITYSLNNGSFRQYSTSRTLEFSKGGDFKRLVVRATDQLGNTNERTLEFFISRD